MHVCKWHRVLNRWGLSKVVFTHTLQRAFCNSLGALCKSVQENRVQKNETFKQSQSSLQKGHHCMDLKTSKRKGIFNQPTDAMGLKVAIIGEPNAGKSTLANQLLGWKFAPASKKVHTTRRKAVGVITKENTQIVLLDTPGLIHPGKQKRHNLETSLLTDPHSSLFEADALLVVVDVGQVWGQVSLGEETIKSLLLHPEKQAALVLNKVDKVQTKGQLLQIARSLTDGVVGGKPTADEPIKPKTGKPLAKSLFEQMDQVRHSGVTDGGEKDNEEGISASSAANLSSNGESQGVINDIGNDCHMSHEDEMQQNLSDEELANQLCIKQGAYEAQGDEQRNINLKDPSIWKNYETRLKHVTGLAREMKGWPHFDQVFMVSALEGEGVSEIKKYLMDIASPKQWQFPMDTLTDQKPKELVKGCIRALLLEHLPAEIPYQIHFKLVMWEMNEDGSHDLVLDLICPSKRHVVNVIGHKGETVKQIVEEAQRELENSFQCKINLWLWAKERGQGKDK